MSSTTADGRPGADVPTAPAPERDPAPTATPRCPNCGSLAADAYCPRCGQEQIDLRRSLRAHAADLVDALAGWDGKIPRTLWALVRRPGLLTSEFLAGRRVRYVRPLKLYLWLSVLFFLSLSVGDGGVRTRERRPAAAAPPAAPGAAAARGEAPPAPDSFGQRRIDPADRSLRARLERAFGARVEALAALPDRERDRMFKQAFLANAGRTAFALLPAFALLLRLLYLRGPWYYAEHLVFALHVHALAMIALTLAHFAPGSWALLPQLWVPAALFVAMRRVYGESRRRTAAKFVALSAGYLVVSAVALLVTVFVTLMLLPA